MTDDINWREILPSSCPRTGHNRTACVRAACGRADSGNSGTARSTGRPYSGAPTGGGTRNRCWRLPRRFCTGGWCRTGTCRLRQISGDVARTAPIHKKLPEVQILHERSEHSAPYDAVYNIYEMVLTANNFNINYWQAWKVPGKIARRYFPLIFSHRNKWQM